MHKWLWLMLAPSLVLAAPPPSQRAEGSPQLQAAPESPGRSLDAADPTFTPSTFMASQRSPVYLDVEAEQLTILPENITITKAEFELPDGKFNSFLDRIEAVRDTNFILLLLRPGSAVFVRQLRPLFRDRGIIVRFEPWEADRKFTWPPPPVFVPDTVGSPQVPTMPTNETLVYVTVRADSITLPPGPVVVSSAELQTAGNPFDRLLDRFEAQGECPRICLVQEPGGEALSAQLDTLIQERGARMDCQMGIFSNTITVRVATAKEIPGDSSEPVYFECRQHQLFSISLDRLAQAVQSKTTELKAAANGDETQFLKSAAMSTLEVDGHQIDFTYALINQYVLTPLPDAKGYAFADGLKETDDMWFGSQLAQLDPHTQSLFFFVRPDSYKTFQQARTLALQKNFTVNCELLNEIEPIRLCSGGLILR